MGRRLYAEECAREIRIRFLSRGREGQRRPKSVRGRERLSRVSRARCRGGREGFWDFQAQGEGDYRFGQRSRVTDAEAREVVRRILGDIVTGDVKAMERPRRNALLFDLKDAGLSVRQIERLTGLGKWIISEA